MVLFALTNITMDVTLGVAWWVVKNTVYGTYCLGSYLFCTTEPPKEDKDVLELKYQIAELNKKLDRISSMNDLTITQTIQQPVIIDTSPIIIPIEEPDVKSHVDVDDAFVLVDE
jgi:hypothetical protein